jgi:hypothetical protein
VHVDDHVGLLELLRVAEDFGLVDRAELLQLKERKRGRLDGRGWNVSRKREREQEMRNEPPGTSPLHLTRRLPSLLKRLVYKRSQQGRLARPSSPDDVDQEDVAGDLARAEVLAFRPGDLERGRRRLVFGGRLGGVAEVAEVGERDTVVEEGGHAGRESANPPRSALRSCARGERKDKPPLRQPSLKSDLPCRRHRRIRKAGPDPRAAGRRRKQRGEFRLGQRAVLVLVKQLKDLGEKLVAARRELDRAVVWHVQSAERKMGSLSQNEGLTSEVAEVGSTHFGRRTSSFNSKSSPYPKLASTIQIVSRSVEGGKHLSLSRPQVQAAGRGRRKELTHSSLVDEARVEVEHALGCHALVRYHRRVVLGDDPEERVDLLELQRRVEALALEGKTNGESVIRTIETAAGFKEVSLGSR